MEIWWIGFVGISLFLTMLVAAAAEEQDEYIKYFVQNIQLI